MNESCKSFLNIRVLENIRELNPWHVLLSTIFFYCSFGDMTKKKRSGDNFKPEGQEYKGFFIEIHTTEKKLNTPDKFKYSVKDADGAVLGECGQGDRFETKKTATKAAKNLINQLLVERNNTDE
jgi:hypothetical protein